MFSNAGCKKSNRRLPNAFCRSTLGSADLWGRMSARRPIPVIDGLLAATAKVHDMTLVTRNASNVEGLGAKVLNPFET